MHKWIQIGKLCPWNKKQATFWVACKCANTPRGARIVLRTYATVAILYWKRSREHHSVEVRYLDIPDIREVEKIEEVPQAALACHSCDMQRLLLQVWHGLTKVFLNNVLLRLKRLHTLVFGVATFFEHMSTTWDFDSRICHLDVGHMEVVFQVQGTHVRHLGFCVVPYRMHFDSLGDLCHDVPLPCCRAAVPWWLECPATFCPQSMRSPTRAM